MAKIRNAFNVFAAEDVDLTPVRFDPAGDDVFQEYIVPFGIKKLKLEVVAAKGFNGANGGKVECVLNVKPKQKLFVYAGRMGTSATECIYNASDIRTSDEGITDDTSLHSRLIVAGAGGAYSWGYAAGPGGGLIGGQGGWDIITTGFPGTQTEGGCTLPKQSRNYPRNPQLGRRRHLRFGWKRPSRRRFRLVWRRFWRYCLRSKSRRTAFRRRWRFILYGS